jgi:hypothetical protein
MLGGGLTPRPKTHFEWLFDAVGTDLESGRLPQHAQRLLILRTVVRSGNNQSLRPDGPGYLRPFMASVTHTVWQL